MIYIDGAIGEGGGQIIRTSLSLSAISGESVRITNIRKQREPSGLRYQHIISARSLRKISRGYLEGDELGSDELIFIPGKIVAGRYKFVIPTAGSGILLAQTIIPVLIYGEKESKIEIEGGTHVPNSPCFDYFKEIFIRTLNFMGINITAELIKSGYYPRGGGKIAISLKPSKGFTFPSIFPKENIICGKIRICNLPLHIAIREKKVFLENNIEEVSIVEEKRCYGKGNSIFLKKGFSGCCSIGNKGIRAEEVAKKCLEEITKIKEGIDKYLADQIMIYAALYSNNSGNTVKYKTSEITKHSKTNAYVIEKFLDIKFDFNHNEITITPR